MLWQRFMIRVARSAWIQRLMQSRASLSRLARRFVGGATLDDAIGSCRALREQGIRVSLFYMGEYVSDPRKVEATVERKREAAAALGAAGLDVHLSVDPTQIGYLQSWDRLRANATLLARTIAAAAGRGAGGGVDVLMLDMEDESLVDDTIALYVELRRAGLPAGLTLQAYLRRTTDDLEPLVASPGMVRLVKGAFAAGPDVAFSGRDAIRRSYLELARRMLSPAAAAAGFYPVFATHDDRLIQSILKVADAQGRAPDTYEIEMLYGVRPQLQRTLAGEGVRVRAYVPFGPDWWPYAARRVGENPRNATLLPRALTSPLLHGGNAAERVAAPQSRSKNGEPEVSQPE